MSERQFTQEEQNRIEDTMNGFAVRELKKLGYKIVPIQFEYEEETAPIEYRLDFHGDISFVNENSLYGYYRAIWDIMTYEDVNHRLYFKGLSKSEVARLRDVWDITEERK